MCRAASVIEEMIYYWNIDSTPAHAAQVSTDNKSDHHNFCLPYLQKRTCLYSNQFCDFLNSGETMELSQTSETSEISQMSEHSGPSKPCETSKISQTSEINTTNELGEPRNRSDSSNNSDSLDPDCLMCHSGIWQKTLILYLQLTIVT